MTCFCLSGQPRALLLDRQKMLMTTVEGTVISPAAKNSAALQKMERWKIGGRLVAVIVMCAATGLLHGDDQGLWRTWGVRDGFAETYTYRLSVTSKGEAYARHGAVRSMSVFDGYRVIQIPEPRRQAQPYLPLLTRTYTCPGCTTWVNDEAELARR